MRILVVDDQRSARRVLSTLLAPLADVEIFEASDLEEAKAVLAREPITVALIDIRLGSDPTNPDGLELVREVRYRSTAIPIVVTSSSEMAEIRTAMRYGAHDYILKDDLCHELVLPISCSSSPICCGTQPRLPRKAGTSPCAPATRRQTRSSMCSTTALAFFLRLLRRSSHHG